MDSFIMELFTVLGVVWAITLVLRLLITRIEHKEFVNNIKQQVADRIHEVQLEKIEESGNLLLAYDKENNRFLGQADSVDNLKTVLMQRWPDRIFIINGEPFSALEKAQ